MSRCFPFVAAMFLGGCLFLTGCPQNASKEGGDAGKSESEPVAVKQETKEPVAEAVATPPKPTENLPEPEADPADVAAAIALLDKNNGSYEKNAAGAVVGISLALSRVLDSSSESETGALFDAINKLVDLEKVSFDGPGIDDFGVTRLTDLKKVKTALFQNTNITTASLESLAETMPELTELSVNRCLKLDGDSLIAIADGMPQLKILDLRSNAFKTFDIRVLPDLPALEQLDLRQCTSIEGDALKYMEEIPTLKVLRLRGTSYRDSSIATLAGHPGLRTLFLQDANVSDECLDSIKDIPNLADLSLFRLADITNDGLKKLEGAKLQRLMIRDNENINNDGIAIVQTLPELNRLTLYEVRSITDEGLIAAVKGNKKLVDLALYDMASITDKSLDAIRTTTALRSMELRKTGQTDETLKLVARLPRLETVVIGDNSSFTDAGLAALGESKSIKKISIMDQTGISEKAIEEFRAKYPKITLTVGGTGQHSG